MILQFRVGDIEATFDSDGDGVTPEAAQEYLTRAARVAFSTWKALPNNEPAPADIEGDTSE